MNTDVGFLDPDVPSRHDDKFDAIVRWYNDDRDMDDPARRQLSKSLQEQYERWQYIYSILTLPKIRFKSDTMLVKRLKEKWPTLSDRVLRYAIADTRRFYAQLEQPVLDWERVMLITNMKRAMERAEKKGDFKSLGAMFGHYIKLIGADKPQTPVDNRTIINIINFNPEQLGGKQIPDDKLEALIAQMQAGDKKKQQALFDDFEDVSAA